VSQLDQIQLNFDSGSILVLNLVLAALMFGVALELHPRDFARLLKAPRAAAVGLLCQFLLLPAATFALVKIIDPTPSVALGMMLVAACPGGNISNVICYLSGANTALSVGMTAVSSSAATVLTPLNFAFWASLHASTGGLLAEVSISPLEVLGTVFLVLGLPLAVGMFVGSRFPTLVYKLRKPVKTVAGVVFLTFVVGALVKNAQHLNAGLLPVLGVVVLHNGLALGLGYGVALASGLAPADRRTVCIEVGIQNSTLALAIIFSVFHGMGGMAIVAALWGLWHMIAGGALAVLWSSKPIEPAIDPVQVGARA
jgi:BASS family bile acid:Na+ symporter